MRVWAETIYLHLLAVFVTKALLGTLLSLIGDIGIFGSPRQGLVSFDLTETC